MKLIKAVTGPFRSINVPQDVDVGEQVSVLVGMNESGKTVFLKALERSNDALSEEEYDVVEDYPRKDLTAYLKRHKEKPETVAVLTYRIDDAERKALNATLGTSVGPNFEFSVTHKYDNTSAISISVEEKPVIRKLAETAGISTDAKTAISAAKSLREILKAFEGKSLAAPDQQLLTDLEARIKAVPAKWGSNSIVEYEAWAWLRARVPKFLYFGEYEILPSKVNLKDLQNRAAQAKNNPAQFRAEDKAILALLRMADISVGDLAGTAGYEPLKAKIEAVSINLTDQIMEFWKQNENLEVEVDIKADPQDVPPFNDGANLYLRIKNKRHRGVSTPFRQRSRGFIWFFSFLVWFDRVQHQLEALNKETVPGLIILLDEPGLNLHALAQRDFLRYIDELAKKHQVVYSTHSPFMVHMDRMQSIRMVEDREKVGTVISSNLQGSDPRTLFPLQAALGWTIAQSLFISARNLLVEGPADLAVLTVVSAALELDGREGLREDVTIVPTGGLDKLATFIALLGANDLELAVFHDYKGSPEKRLEDLEEQKMLQPKSVLTAAQFRDVATLGSGSQPSDLEDMLPVDTYLEYFNKAFAKRLGGNTVAEKDLPAGDRIIDRLNRWLASKSIKLKADGGFNHYLVAAAFGQNPPKKLDAGTLERFEALFKAVNKLFSK